MLIAIGLAVGYRANVWNIGAEGQLIAGRDRRRRRRARVRTAAESPLVLPAMIVAGALGGMAWAAIPALAAHALQRQRDPDVADARLRRDARCCRCSCTARGAIRRASTSRSRSCSPTARCCRCSSPGTRLNVGVPRRARGRRRGLASSCARASPASRCASPGLAPAAAHYAGISAHAHRVDSACCRRRVRRPRRRRRGRRADRPAAAVGVAGLRLRRDHRRVRRPAASGRHPVREPADVAALPRRRGGADRTSRCRRR